jgi:diaminopimelate epimerase
MKIDFVKIEGSGNDFILIDSIKKELSGIDWGKTVPVLCDRKFGVGADGVLLLESHSSCDFTMRIFNPDGSEVEMCGNGARCSAYYFLKKEKKENISFNTIAGVMRAEGNEDGRVRLSLPDPTKAEMDIFIKLPQSEIGVSFINTGVPHVVVETSHLDAVEVEKMGRMIRNHNRFAPEGTNVDFVMVTGESSLEVRTYERGVEEETLACGTGVIASAAIESLKGKVVPPVTVKTRGGDILKVYFTLAEHEDLLSRIRDVKLEGKVNLVFKGQIDLN